MGTCIILLLIIGVFGAVVYALSVKFRNEKFNEFCSHNGMKSTERRYTFFNQFPFRLFQEGHKRTSLNFYEKDLDGAVFILCDYRYTVITEHYNRKTMQKEETHTNYTQTVGIIEDNTLTLPEMFLRKEKSVLDWLAEKFGGQDIDFNVDPAFSDLFVLQGSVVDRIKETFSGKLRKHFVENRDLFKTFETYDTAFMINYGSRVSGLSIKEFSDFLLETCRILRKQQSVSEQAGE